MTALMSIVLATGNRGKLAELRSMLADLPVEILSTEQALPLPLTVVEDGETFEHNARKKATEVSEATMMVTLADDSGLEVDALGGRPGVRSARFSGEGATDAENNQALLAMMQDVDDDDRSARFRCVIALVDPFDPDNVQIAEGSCNGRIARTPSGHGGFGYDPLFIVDDSGRTMAELDEAEKNRISHRGRALAALHPRLVDLVRAKLAEATEILNETAD